MMTSWNGHISALLAICAGNSTVPGEFPAQRPVTQSFDIFVDLRPNKRVSKQSWGWWFETPSCTLWRHCNEKRRFSIASIITPHELYWSMLWCGSLVTKINVQQCCGVIDGSWYLNRCSRNSSPPWIKWPPIWQTIFSDAFSWMKSFLFWLKFHWSLFVRIQLTISQYWFR